MDSEEIRRIRREKILQRSGIVEKKQEAVEVKEEEKQHEEDPKEVSIREQMEIIESIEEYKVLGM